MPGEYAGAGVLQDKDACPHLVVKKKNTGGGLAIRYAESL